MLPCHRRRCLLPAAGLEVQRRATARADVEAPLGLDVAGGVDRLDAAGADRHAAVELDVIGRVPAQQALAVDARAEDLVAIVEVEPDERRDLQVVVLVELEARTQRAATEEAVVAAQVEGAQFAAHQQVRERVGQVGPDARDARDAGAVAEVAHRVGAHAHARLLLRLGRRAGQRVHAALEAIDPVVDAVDAVGETPIGARDVVGGLGRVAVRALAVVAGGVAGQHGVAADVGHGGVHGDGSVVVDDGLGPELAGRRSRGSRGGRSRRRAARRLGLAAARTEHLVLVGRGRADGVAVGVEAGDVEHGVLRQAHVGVAGGRALDRHVDRAGAARAGAAADVPADEEGLRVVVRDLDGDGPLERAVGSRRGQLAVGRVRRGDVTHRGQGEGRDSEQAHALHRSVPPVGCGHLLLTRMGPAER